MWKEERGRFQREFWVAMAAAAADNEPSVLISGLYPDLTNALAIT